MTKPSEKGTWDPNKYPSTLLASMAVHALLDTPEMRVPGVTFSLMVVSGHTMIILEATAIREVLAVDIGPIECSAQRAIELWNALIHDWGSLATDEYKKFLCETVRAKDYFKQTVNLLEKMRVAQQASLKNLH